MRDPSVPVTTADLIEAAYRRPVMSALLYGSNGEQRRLAQPELACGTRVGDVATKRRDCLVATSCRTAGRVFSAGSAAVDFEGERAARP